MNVERHPWVAVANFGIGWEADLAVARLDAAGIPARAIGNDHVGIFGPGYQGASVRGFDVQVPAPFAVHAKDVLARPPEPFDEDDASEDGDWEVDEDGDADADEGADEDDSR